MRRRRRDHTIVHLDIVATHYGTMPTLGPAGQAQADQMWAHIRDLLTKVGLDPHDRVDLSAVAVGATLLENIRRTATDDTMRDAAYHVLVGVLHQQIDTVTA